ncbi:3-phosphoshikimate 1-carboxyvinyltransferase [Flavobacterium oreochromis]|uniref:3-phosphoshikimate 1-carboxyvinyltransferase n=1 Tax=Flavobacterium columnare TaxID=996 RepID=A0A246GAQ7_9FLAO|nr:3-phosphoshikimate 1-carboxyvinyltransferase [Flavobacterium oreochromis]OWP77196.1 3-phosphoshikimate 1-carboxyvinyltransferase [Flavobacterium oreochromis]POR27549.1 3-phosphoshikimate 1-carboxyvinyltransferase [Flavobacterium columnare]
MNLGLKKSKVKSQKLKLKITGSKSETNRLLLLQALYPEIEIENISNSDDSDVMQDILAKFKQKLDVLNFKYDIDTYDVHHAGTAMRFLTAFFAIQEGAEVVLTGSPRMKERPIQILVEALNQLGAEILYEEEVGFPPLRIKGKKLNKCKVSLPANVSSQYISALLLIAPKLENGLELTLEGEITSIPYIKMTLALLNELGIQTSFDHNIINVCSQPSILNSQFTIESDWSSASYWYSIIALSQVDTDVTLLNYKKNSLQGDAILSEIYRDFGVQTIFNSDNTITISKKENFKLSTLNCQLNESPDIAQTIAVTCFGLGLSCNLYGLHTLKIKETDRLEALKKELIKLGAEILVTNESLHLQPSTFIKQNITIKTYQDHRMAMAFTPLALRVPIIIEDAEVVSKSYPDFWNDLTTMGFSIY